MRSSVCSSSSAPAARSVPPRDRCARRSGAFWRRCPATRTGSSRRSSSRSSPGTTRSACPATRRRSRSSTTRPASRSRSWTGPRSRPCAPVRLGSRDARARPDGRARAGRPRGRCAGRSHIDAATRVRDFAEVRVASRNADHARALADEVGGTAWASFEEAVAGRRRRLRLHRCGRSRSCSADSLEPGNARDLGRSLPRRSGARSGRHGPRPARRRVARRLRALPGGSARAAGPRPE